MNAIHAGITIGVTELRESPTRILKRAEEEDQAVAILNHNKPATTPQFRHIYHVDDTKHLLTILSIASRDDVYDELRERLA